MEDIKRKLIKEAQGQFKDISPCLNGTGTGWDGCFTFEGNKVLFWFNTSDCSTKLLNEEL